MRVRVRLTLRPLPLPAPTLPLLNSYFPSLTHIRESSKESSGIKEPSSSSVCLFCISIVIVVNFRRTARMRCAPHAPPRTTPHHIHTTSHYIAISHHITHQTRTKSHITHHRTISNHIANLHHIAPHRTLAPYRTILHHISHIAQYRTTHHIALYIAHHTLAPSHTRTTLHHIAPHRTISHITNSHQIAARTLAPYRTYRTSQTRTISHHAPPHRTTQ